MKLGLILHNLGRLGFELLKFIFIKDAFLYLKLCLYTAFYFDITN